jgi:hypothetical protein
MNTAQTKETEATAVSRIRHWLSAIHSCTTFKPDHLSSGEIVVSTVLIFVALALTATHINHTYVDPDELGHLHSAWLWSQGLTPFVDFFEHHPPFYWLALRPVLALSEPNNLTSLAIGARIISLIVVALSIGFSYLAGSEILASRRAGLFLAVAWALFCPLSHRILHARPDQPMLLFLIAGTYFSTRGLALVRTSRKPSQLFAFAGGLFLAGAVCILPKAIFWAILFGTYVFLLPILFKQYRNKSYFWALVGFLGGVALVGILMFLWIYLFSNWEDFWYCNVVRNRRISGRLVKRDLYLDIVQNPFSWAMPSSIAAAIGAFFLLFNKQLVKIGIVSVGLASGLALVLMALSRWHHYHFPFLWWFSFLAAYAYTCVTAKLKAGWKILFAVIIIAPMGVSFANDFRKLDSSFLKTSLTQQQFVLDRAKPEDTFIAFSQRNPVFMTNAAPRLWMSRMVGYTRKIDQQFMDEISANRPRFIIDSPLRRFQVPRTFERNYRRITPVVWERVPDHYRRRPRPFSKQRYKH